MKSLKMLPVAMVVSWVSIAQAVTFTVDSCKQRYPWNGLVDIDYTVTYGDGEVALDSKFNRMGALRHAWQSMGTRARQMAGVATAVP